MMGEYESNIKYAKSVSADIRKPKWDGRTTSQRITDEMKELRAALAEKEREIKKLKGCDIRLGDDYGDDPVELVLLLKRELAELREMVRQYFKLEEIKIRLPWESWWKPDEHHKKCRDANLEFEKAAAALRAAVEKT